MQRTIVLPEYQPIALSSDTFSQPMAQQLWPQYARFVSVEYPSPKTANQWQLTALGWVGMAPIGRDLTLVLQPKVTIAHLLQMVEVAYGLQRFHLLRGLVQSATIPEFYERLATLLAQRVLERCRRGLYRPYQPQESTTPFVRGRIQIDALLRQPMALTTPCCYHEQSVDIEDNQILRWTLHRILQSDLAAELAGGNMRALVRQALRTLNAAVSLRPFFADDCRRRRYTRLHDDYAQLHALCAFFLEASGPSHLPGETASIPFLVNMAQLYEQFVATWLQCHLPTRWQLQMQERHPLSDQLHFAIDLVLYDRAQGNAVAVLDTKYKVPDQGPATADVAQVVAYAAAKGVTEAILIYPQALATPLDTTVGAVRVRTLAFRLDCNLDEAGHQLLAELMQGRVEWRSAP